MSREIVEVYADWYPIDVPLLIGQLAYSDSSRGRNPHLTFDDTVNSPAHACKMPLQTNERKNRLASQPPIFKTVGNRSLNA